MAIPTWLQPRKPTNMPTWTPPQTVPNPAQTILTPWEQVKYGSPYANPTNNPITNSFNNARAVTAPMPVASDETSRSSGSYYDQGMATPPVVPPAVTDLPAGENDIRSGATYANQQTPVVVTEDAPRSSGGYYQSGAVTPPSSTTPPSGIFTGLNAPVAGAVNQTIEDMATGKITDPFAAGAREARARQEANARASSANRIAASGFSGTGIGQQLGAAQEGAISKNRFDSEVGIEQMRNQNRIAGVNMATTVGQAQQQSAESALNKAVQFGSPEDVMRAYKSTYGTDLDPASVGEYIKNQRTLLNQTVESNKVALDTLKSTAAGSNLAKNVLAHRTWATNPEEAWADPSFVNNAQAAWEAAGQQGPVPKDWALKQLGAITDPVLNNPMLYQRSLIDQVPNLTQEQKDLMYKVSDMGYFDSKYWELDENGDPKFKRVGEDGAPEITPPEGGFKPGQTGVSNGTPYEVNAMGKPVNIEFNADDPWGADADKIILAGKDKNNLYSKVVEARISAINNDIKGVDLSKIAKLPTNDPVYQAAIEKLPTTRIANHTDDSLMNPAPVGSYVKIKDMDGNPVLAKVTSSKDGDYFMTVEANGKKLLYISAIPGEIRVNTTNDFGGTGAKTYSSKDWYSVS